MERDTSVRYPGGTGVLWGVAAYLLGFGANYVLVSSRLSAFRSRATVTVEDTTYTVTELAGSGGVPTWKLAGLSFYNTHFVEAVFSGFVGVFGQAGWKSNLVSSAGGVFQLLFAITPLLLVGSGVAITRTAAESTDLRFAFGTSGSRFFLNGAVITLFGYLPLAVAGGLLFSADLGENVVVRADLLKSIVIAGVVYPFLFGGLGGYLRSRASRGGGVPNASEV
ncbi:hypothetical protein M0R88_07575 [Halorussus gelatinilyticus]|uniref:DUF7978 domain-containing protein n=1 Tax=Halorussus gelatinilyticus TaxID=2937524 RepID=A0A8U0ILC9_9EURY|nr:hypothetical protein [Halorussus gelatinilyticus]UPW01947.1 hypothetical protein M0R88_07575 [Halorussus gelatinilyticus]